MTTNNANRDAYRRTQVLTANRETILLMLYEGGLRFLKGAAEAAKRRDLPEKARLVGRAQDIVNELRATLNFDASPELAVELDRLYDFVTQKLTQAVSQQTSEPIVEATKILETLHRGWAEAIAGLRTQPAPNELK